MPGANVIMEENDYVSEPVFLTDDGKLIRAAIVAARAHISAAVSGAIGNATGPWEIRGINPWFKLDFHVIVRLPKAAVLIKIWETDQMMAAMVAPPSTPTEVFDAAVDVSGRNINVRESLANVPGSAMLFGYNSYDKRAELYGNADEFGSVAEAVLRAWMSFSGECEESVPQMMI